MRESIGEDVDLMCDINQLWSVPQAIEIGKRIEPYHLFWLEDPTAHDDFAGLARVADNLVTPIAAGEYHYGIQPFRHLIEQRSIDMVMIDLLRVGGITQWMKVAGMAEAFNMPVVSPPDSRDPRAPGGGDSERSDGGVHAVDTPPVRVGAGDPGRPACGAGQAGFGIGVG